MTLSTADAHPVIKEPIGPTPQAIDDPAAAFAQQPPGPWSMSPYAQPAARLDDGAGLVGDTPVAAADVRDIPYSPRGTRGRIVGEPLCGSRATISTVPADVGAPRLTAKPALR